MRKMYTTQRSVRSRIFISNTVMVLVALVLFLAINLLVLKFQVKGIEHQMSASIESIVDIDGMKNIEQIWERDKTVLIFGMILDGAVCVIALLLLSQLFTKHLIDRIMEPLDALSAGAERVQAGNLTERIQYQGDVEFEEVCSNFNMMQAALQIEKEANERYEKARTEMIAGISHDLRTPLTAIRGTVKGLLDGVADSPEKRRTFLAAAYRRTEEMDRMLEKLFFFSRLETGNIRIETSPVDITEFLQNYVDAKKEADPNLDIQLETESGLSEGRVAAVIDPDQTIRALDNLVQNSRQYAKVPDLAICITLTADTRHVRICVGDNGQGVPDEKLPHIFEEFYRCDESRGMSEGSGLGLYFVKFVVQAMGGTVHAYNRPEGHGLAVVLELPRAEEKLPPEVAPEAAKES